MFMFHLTQAICVAPSHIIWFSSSCAIGPGTPGKPLAMCNSTKGYLIQSDAMAHLVAGENQSIRHHDVFAPTSGENNDLGDIIGRQRLAAAVGLLVSIRT